MKNKLMDLNDHLFAQLERLGDEDLTAEKLTEEIGRGKAISTVAQQVISNAQLALDAEIAIAERVIRKAPLMLGVSENKG